MSCLLAMVLLPGTVRAIEERSWKMWDFNIDWQRRSITEHMAECIHTIRWPSIILGIMWRRKRINFLQISHIINDWVYWIVYEESAARIDSREPSWQERSFQKFDVCAENPTIRRTKTKQPHREYELNSMRRNIWTNRVTNIATPPINGRGILFRKTMIKRWLRKKKLSVSFPELQCG